MQVAGNLAYIVLLSIVTCPRALALEDCGKVNLERGHRSPIALRFGTPRCNKVRMTLGI